MGEHADDILNGDVCERCGEWLDGGEGAPRLCNNCFRKFDFRKDRAERRRRADKEYLPAAKRASSLKLALHKFTEAHYQLRHIGDPTWILNVYPGNRRLYAEPARPRPPYLKLPADWGLKDIVEAAIAATRLPDTKEQ